MSEPVKPAAPAESSPYFKLVYQIMGMVIYIWGVTFMLKITGYFHYVGLDHP